MKIVIAGTRIEDRDFLFNAINKIIELSGHTQEFSVFIASPKDDTKEFEADLIFTQFNKPDNSEQQTIDNIVGLVNWLRHPKHAYCMVSEEHPMGLNNYNNFKSIIVPLNLVFNPLRFDIDKSGKAVSPSVLIEALRPKKNEQES